MRGPTAATAYNAPAAKVGNGLPRLDMTVTRGIPDADDAMKLGEMKQTVADKTWRRQLINDVRTG
jgi:hypothetical protein